MRTKIASNHLSAVDGRVAPDEYRPLEVSRDRLLRRLTAGKPRAVMLIAPAGYGKSTLLRQYAATFSTSTVCDCATFDTVSSFAAAIAGALAAGDARRTAELSHQRLSGLGDSASWSAFAMESWSRPSVHELFVLENLESVLDSVEHVELLARLLARAPVQRRIAICSRRAMPLSWQRFLPPHEVIVLHANDLRFDRDELAVIFGGVATSKALLDRVEAVSHGWPIAALLMARLAREESFAELIERLSAVSFEQLYDYLADQVLGGLSEEHLRIVYTVAALSPTQLDEVVTVMGNERVRREIKALARSTPFLYHIDGDTYEAHPLVRAAFWERDREALLDILKASAERLSGVMPLRAAQHYLRVGNQHAAAALIDRLDFGYLMNEAEGAFAQIVYQLYRDVLLRYPSVWAASTSVRAPNLSDADWLDEALIVAGNLRRDTPPSVRASVLTSFGNVLANLGRHEEAKAAAAAFEDTEEPLPPRAFALRDLLLASVSAREGRFSEAEEFWKKGEPHFVDVNLTRAIMLMEVPVRAARFRNDRVAERKVLETAVAFARASRNALAIAYTLMESAFGAWLAGEDELFRHHVRELEEAVHLTTERTTEVFRGCARGDFAPIFRGDHVERAKLRCYAALIGAGFAAGEERAALARIALEAAVTAGEPMSVSVAAVALAVSEPEQRSEMTARAVTEAARVDSEELRFAVARFASGDVRCGMLEALVQRLFARPVKPLPQRDVRGEISLSSCSVTLDGKRVSLTGRELELVMFLASRRRPSSATEIADAIWPGLEYRNSPLRVYAQRLRSKLGNETLFVEDGTYRIASSLDVDLDRIEDSILRANRATAVTGEDIACLEAELALLSRPPNPAAARWEWFAPVAVRTGELIRELATLLGRLALRRGDLSATLSIAQHIVDLDACDEPARELRIRAFLGAGDSASAVRELRSYERALEAELGARPSAELYALVQSAQSASTT